MGHTKGELQIKITIDEMYVYHWNNGEKFLIEAFHRPNTKEQAIINHLALCWNSHDALLEACMRAECCITLLLQHCRDGNCKYTHKFSAPEMLKVAIAAAK